MVMQEISEFKKRNSLSQDVKGIGLVIKDCCPRCLKAHLLKVAKSANLSDEVSLYAEGLDCEEGHNGYYMDNGNLIAL